VFSLWTVTPFSPGLVVPACSLSLLAFLGCTVVSALLSPEPWLHGTWKRGEHCHCLIIALQTNFDGQSVQWSLPSNMQKARQHKPSNGCITVNVRVSHSKEHQPMPRGRLKLFFSLPSGHLYFCSGSIHHPGGPGDWPQLLKPLHWLPHELETAGKQGKSCWLRLQSS
jgi:hypothetical protein